MYEICLFSFYFRERICKTEQLRQQLRASELYDSVQLHATKGKKPPEYLPEKPPEYRKNRLNTGKNLNIQGLFRRPPFFTPGRFLDDPKLGLKRKNLFTFSQFSEISGIIRNFGHFYEISRKSSQHVHYCEKFSFQPYSRP
jgi:hypothetical protein